MRLVLAAALVASLLAPLAALHCSRGTHLAVEISGLCRIGHQGHACQSRSASQRVPALCQAQCAHESLRNQDRLTSRSILPPTLVHTEVVAWTTAELPGRHREGFDEGGRAPPAPWPEAPLILLI